MTRYCAWVILKNVTKKSAILIFAAIIILVFGFLVYQNRHLLKRSSPANRVTKSVVTSKTIKITEKINSESSELDLPSGSTALDAIKKNPTVKITHYSFGDLVTSINGFENGTNDMNWIVYLNGIKSKVGVGDIKLKNGDVVEWKFEKYEE